MNLDDTRPTRVKPGYTCKSPGLPEKYLDASRPTYAAHDAISPCPRASALLAARNSCSSTRTVACAAATRVLRRLRRSGGRGMPMAVRTMRLRCVLLQDRGGAWHALLRSQSAHRNEAAQQAGCCQQGPMLPHARIVQRGPAYTGFSDMRLFELEAIYVRNVWLEIALKKSNENRKRRMLRRRLLSMRRIDRPPQAKKIWGLRRIVDHGGSLLAPGRATADLADVRGSR